ncbi:efflux RND transporter periplasmic adaptor subunit [Alginatibacterium sediminis]|uniref:Efflux RND transporter periplasmic adaptor subunit n=1 Tax=Alginatibacterium sediminis TaxID=2164068 RepID=A0A420EL74_9ALTE|nr:efflux RND transporter periplasmic adaptor subunit [Alginatibacterium sediminis]RKF21356.1 efflux RND transporter periplasmic adaptor subunit [Alginatibacterium sediminis]
MLRSTVFFICAGLLAYFAFSQLNALKQPESGRKGRTPSAIEVATASVAAQNLNSSVKLVANLNAVTSVEISSLVTARIDDILVSEQGTVEQDQLLIQLDDRRAKSNVVEMKALLSDQERILNDFIRLVDRGAVTVTEIDAQRALVAVARARLEAETVELSEHQIKAPFAGTVSLIDFSRGKLVNSGEELLQLDDLSKMRLDVNVPEQYLSKLALGMQVSATTAAWSNRLFEGELVAIDSRVNDEALNIRVRIEFGNQDLLLKPGMLMSASLHFPEVQAAVIPVQALEYSGTKRYVYRLDEENTARRTEVKLGARIDNLVMIESGVDIGDEIVVEGLVNIRDGVKVKTQNQAKSEQEPRGDKSKNGPRAAKG